jgi:hypothetical protein
MKFYFGEVPEQDATEFGIDSLFEKDGSYYYYCVEYGSNPGGFDDIMISDTCNREVPVSVENLQNLVSILQECMALSMEVAESVELVKDLEDNNKIVEVYGAGNFSY